MKVLRIIGIGFAGLVLVGLGVYVWASYTAGRKLSRTYATHTVDFPIPFPGSRREVASERLAGESDRKAQVAAVERGRHLVESRYGCGGCHGSNFGGGVMVDNLAIGQLLGPNLTTGRGSVTAGYRAADWDRIVRHGVKRDGAAGLMPSQDFRQMSDQELSDIVSFIRSQPAVDSSAPAPTLGPIGKVLVATGKFTLSADLIAHDRPHAVAPPDAEVTTDFGRHVAGACMGCHRDDLGGGPIVGGDPAWPAAANLTPGPEGLGGWTFTDFARVMREAKRPDGSAIRPPMSELTAYARRMTEVELQALWSYLRSVPPVADRE